MNDQNIKVARILGWKIKGSKMFRHEQDTLLPIPNYSSDLSTLKEMHEFILSKGFLAFVSREQDQAGNIRCQISYPKYDVWDFIIKAAPTENLAVCAALIELNEVMEKF